MMTHFKGKYRVESARLRGWDYSSAGWYFVTLCTRGGECILGEVVDGQVHLSQIGEIVAEEWQKTQRIRPDVELDQWIIMPNHIHGIIVIEAKPVLEANETSHRDVSTEAPQPRPGISKPTMPHLKPGSLGSIVGQFKSVSTKRIRASGFRTFNWQPRFYDHVIRDEESLRSIRDYITYNPVKWLLDRDNMANLYM